LTAEAAAGDPQTIGLAARILRRSLVGAGTIALAFTTGVGAGVGENAYQRFEASRAEAERCLLAVETEVPSAQAALAMALNEELAEIRNRVDSLLAEPGISRHPAFMNPEYQERASGLGLDADRQDLLRHLTGSLNGLQFVYGYDDEEDENLESVKAEIERLGAQVNVLHTTIQAAE